MTITEFLEARIAEDEAHVRRVGSFVNECQECAFGNQPDSPYSHERLLADCAAKRAIIEGLEPFSFLDDINAPELLGILAAVYSDHPDYQQEWAPDEWLSA